MAAAVSISSISVILSPAVLIVAITVITWQKQRARWRLEKHYWQTFEIVDTLIRSIHLPCSFLQVLLCFDGLLLTLCGCRTAGSRFRVYGVPRYQSVSQAEARPSGPPHCTVWPAQKPLLFVAQRRSLHPGSLQPLAAQSWLQSHGKGKEVGTDHTTRRHKEKLDTILTSQNIAKRRWENWHFHFKSVNHEHYCKPSATSKTCLEKGMSGSQNY